MFLFGEEIGLLAQDIEHPSPVLRGNILRFKGIEEGINQWLSSWQ